MLEKARSELKQRCQNALASGFQIAHADRHVKELSTLFGSLSHPKPGSTEHLLALLEAIEDGSVKKVAPPSVAVTPPPPPVRSVIDDLEAPIAETHVVSKKSRKEKSNED